jgi:nitrite reductase (NADH) small subunit/3-phenylpropionate/trans-cinnamate dioxygenase ferredoxin subunit
MSSPSFQTIRLASIEDIPEGSGREFQVGKRYVAIFRHNGQFYALEDVCPHVGAPLNNGPLYKGTVTCLWHGWRFNLHDGVCVSHPRGYNVNVPTYPVTVRGYDLYVTLPVDGTPSA